MIFYRGPQFNNEVIETVKSFGIQPKRTSFRSPWQNGVAERWVGNCRRDLLDHVIVLNERHLKRLMSEYIRYYHDDRTHLALEHPSSLSAYPCWSLHPPHSQSDRRVAGFVCFSVSNGLHTAVAEAPVCHGYGCKGTFPTVIC